MTLPKSRTRHTVALVSTLTALSTAIALAPVATATATSISDASFTWGVSGYVQNAAMTADNVNAIAEPATQTHYTPAAMPATSMPRSTAAGAGAKALTFKNGTGTKEDDGSLTINWTGSATFRASYSNTYSIKDPQLTLDAAGNGQMTAEFASGSNAQDGVLTSGTNLGRLPIMTYKAGTATTAPSGEITLNPEYIGVEVEGSASYPQVRTCTGTASDFGDGWWGSWPAPLVQAALGVKSNDYYVFYNRRCTDADSTKRQLPVELTYSTAAATTTTTTPATSATSAAPATTSTPATATSAEKSVTISQSTFNADGSYEVTVSGKGFVGNAQGSGFYFGFGKFATAWRPSEGNPTSSRPVTRSSVTWAVPASSYAAMSAQFAKLVTKLNADGTFSHKITISKAEADALNAGEGNYGIYTYASHGASDPTIETYTPVTFIDPVTVTETATTTAVATTTEATTVTETSVVSTTPAAAPAGTVTATTTVREPAVTTTETAPAVTTTETAPAVTTTVTAPAQQDGLSRSTFALTLAAAGIFGVIAAIVTELLKYVPGGLAQSLVAALRLR